MNEQVNRLDVSWRTLKALLERERERVQAEIHAYPTPIPRCDAQFNHLIEKRERLFQELARLDQVAASSAAAKDGIEPLVKFIDACDCLDDDIKLRLRSASSGDLVKSERS